MKNKKASFTAQNTIGYSANPDTGLNDLQVSEMIKNGQTNKLPSDDQYSIPKIVAKNVFTYFNLIFFIFAAVLITQHSYNHLAFLGVIFSNTVIGIVQEVRSKRILSRLTLVSSPSSKVVRGGNEYSVKNDNLVLGDIIILESGNQIPADATVCSGEIYVNEALVTGEADEIKKVEGDKLLSGSFVVSGYCRARLDAVGADSFAARLSAEAKKTKKRQRPGMMKSLNILIMIIGIIIIPFSVIMFMNQHQTLNLSVKESVENAVASSLGMIPEGLYLLTSIALVASTIRLAKGSTLVHDMKCIESLARVDLICVDKTGTITEPDMKVNSVLPQSSDKTTADKIRDFVFGMETDNVTQKAIKAYFENTEVQNKVIQRKEFSSVYKFSAAKFENGDVYVLGAPEVLLGKDYGAYKNNLDTHFAAGERVLLFGKPKIPSDGEKLFDDAPIDIKIIPLAFITLSNPIRENAAKTFLYFESHGVDVKVISGDNAKTVSYIASRAGIKNAGKYIDLSTLTDEEVSSDKMLEYSVFGRVSPTQKRLLIRNFKKAKHTVAMTGDGVNDVLALKDADCSIAMASGSDAAVSVADLVLVNSDFANMPRVVDEGRRVINNIERTASLFLVKNIFSFIMTLISIFAVTYYPLKPVQISLVSSMMIGIPSFFLALEPNKNRVEGKFLRNVLCRAFPSAFSAVILVAAWLMISSAFSIDYAKITTVSCMIYGFASYMMLFKTCRPFNIRHGILFALMGIGYVSCTVLLPWFFDFTRLDIGCFIIMILLILPAYPLQLGFQKLLSLLFRKRS